MAEHAPKAERHAEDLADDGRERRAADAQLRKRADAEDHQRVEDDVDDRAGQTLTHRDDHVAARLLDLLAHHGDKHENAHAHRDMRILDRKSRNRLARTECADEYTRQSPAEDEERDTADDCQRNAVLRRQVRRLLPSFAQTARDERVYTHACADADRNDQHLERIDERDRRKRILRILRDKDAVDDVVQRVDDHGDHRRERHRKDQRPHFRGSHFVLLFQIYPP